MSIKKVGSRSEKVRKPIFGLAVLIGCAAMALPLTGATLTEYHYTINESSDGVVTQLAVAYTRSESPDDILQSAQIELGEGDTYHFTEPGDDNQGAITIRRSFPVSVTADSETQEILLRGGTVEDALKAAQITLGEEDIVSMELDEEVHAGTAITVNRVEHKIATRKKSVPFETKYEYTNTLIPNAKVKTGNGVKGVCTYTYDEVYIDGELADSTLVSKKVTKKPVHEVYQIGSSRNVPSHYDVPDHIKFDKNGNPVNYKKKVTGKATAYSTRRETSLKAGDVAMDLSQYPRGSWLYIKSRDGSYVYGYARVADTGTGLVEGTVLVDCFFDTFAECYQFGAKTLDVYVLS